MRARNVLFLRFTSAGRAAETTQVLRSVVPIGVDAGSMTSTWIIRLSPGSSGGLRGLKFQT